MEILTHRGSAGCFWLAPRYNNPVRISSSCRAMGRCFAAARRQDLDIQIEHMGRVPGTGKLYSFMMVRGTPFFCSVDHYILYLYKDQQIYCVFQLFVLIYWLRIPGLIFAVKQLFQDTLGRQPKTPRRTAMRQYHQSWHRRSWRARRADRADNKNRSSNNTGNSRTMPPGAAFSSRISEAIVIRPAITGWALVCLS